MTLQPELAGPQSSPAVTARPPEPTAAAVFDGPQRLLLTAVLNRIVPANGSLPGAGDLDVGTSIERTLAGSPRLRRLFLDGLRDIAIASLGDFVSLAPALQTETLQRVEHAHPAFFTALVEHTYRGYYTHREVQRTVGARPPQPLGYDLPPFDPALLDTQRQRAPFWRKVP